MSPETPEGTPHDTVQTAEPDPTQLLPVVNHDIRIFHLASLEPAEQIIDESRMPIIQTRACDVERLAPGLNYVTFGTLQRAGFFNEHTGGYQKEYRGRVVLEDPASMDEFRASALAGQTCSRQALNRWQENEIRPTVKAAIRKRLESRKVKDLAE